MRYLILLSLSLVVLAACNVNEIPKEIIPKDASKFTLTYMNKLIAGDTNYCLNQVQYEKLDSAGRALISDVSRMLQIDKVVSSRLINVRWTSGSIGGKPFNQTLLEYEYTLQHSFGYFSFTLEERNKQFVIIRLKADRTYESLAKVYEFSLKDKSFIAYLFLVLGAMFVIFKIVTLVVAIRTPMQRKVLWLLFIFIGICTFSLNWTTGALNMRLLHIDFIGAGISKGGIIAPWYVSVSLPVGAVCFWIKRRNMRRAAAMDAVIAATYVNDDIEI